MLALQPNPVQNLKPDQSEPQLSPVRVSAGRLCVPNINTRERRKRLVAGIIEFAIALAIWAALVGFGADRWWRLALLPVFWGAATGFFQWRDRT